LNKLIIGLVFILNNYFNNHFQKYLMGIGDWGLGIGDWGLGPIPNPQSPIPNPQGIKL
jgi:hypothetical protein